YILTPILNETFIRIILGILMVLFLPGYSLIVLLFPKKEDLEGVERIALSSCLSISIASLITLLLNYTSFGINLTPILLSLSLFTVLMVTGTYIRRYKIPEEERFTLEFNEHYINLLKSFKTKFPDNKILFIILIISIVLAVSMIAYSIINPREDESFTEFYLLGPNGQAEDYPTNLTLNETGNVIIGIMNHENQKISYKMVISSNGRKIDEQYITLNDEQKTEIPYNFTLNGIGERKLEFLLYKMPDNVNIYRTLSMWINIA
ncbi:MAG: DUF1616 domain-containing protein, partial [Methanobacterium sp.]